MRFSLSLAILGAASVASAFISPGELIRSIDDLVDRTEDLIKPASQLSIANAPQFILGSGPFFASLRFRLMKLGEKHRPDKELGRHHWSEGRDPYHH